MSTVKIDTNSGEFFEILKSFTKSTTINDVESFMGKSLFMMYDQKDAVTGKRDGKFNDTEWQAFEKFRNTLLDSYRQCKDRLTTPKKDKSGPKINQEAIEYYQKEVEKLQKIVEQLEESEQELFKIDYFEELHKYEEEHNLEFKGLKDGETNPEGTFLLENVEPFEIGIPNEDKQTYEGIYKQAYIIGLDKLTKDEQQEYIEKYHQAIEWCAKIKDFEENILGKAIDELSDATIMLGASQDGKVTDRYHSKDIIKKVTEEWRAKNPYLHEIENLEQQINAERVKFNPNAAKIAELQSMVNGLYQLSREWRFSFAEDNTEKTAENGSPNNKKSNLQVSGEVTGIHTDKDGEGCGSDFITDTGVKIGYNKEKYGINVNGSVETKYTTQKREGSENIETQQSYVIGVSTYYNPSESVGLNQSSSFRITPDYKMQNHQLNLRYKNTSLMMTENVREMPVPTYNELTGREDVQAQTTYTTMLMLNQQMGHFNTGTSVQFANEGTTYSINGGYGYEKNLGKKYKIQFSPNVASSYTSSSGVNPDVIMLNGGIGGSITYKNNNFQTEMSINESIGTQFPQVNNNFTVLASANYKGLGFAVSNSNIYSSEMKINTITAGISYKGKNGEVEASYTHSKNTFGEQEDASKSLILTGKIYLDKLFGKK